MAAHNLLDKEVPVYHRFVDNQVLTNDQLNEVIDHINYQDKQTRASLIGIGHVCGINITKNGDNFTVSGGVAVTSDGDLLKVEKTVFTGYKKFKDERVKYGHFIEGPDILDLYELVEDDSPSNVKSLAGFDADASIIDSDKVFILYLESFAKEEEDCSPLECNAQGKEIVRNLKILITSYANAQKIAAKDSIFSNYLNAANINAAINIDTVYVKRIVLNMAKSSTLSTLKNAYSTNFTEISKAITGVGEITLFKKQMYGFSKDIPTFFNGLKQTDFNFQYLYDFYKDLVAAFNELADQLNEVYTICCPDPGGFPKHILRGGLVTKTDALKHRFYPSPIHNHQNSIESLKLMFGRILQMILNFQVSTKDEIILTPSKFDYFKIGERALPFYYDLSASSNVQSMLNSWKLSQNWLLPNYYGNGYPTSFDDPLDYCLDGHDFFRVEGHVGKDVITAMGDITEIRNQKGLAFDILPIAVGAYANEATLDYDKYRIYFEDLQIILQAWNEEIKCIVSGSSQFLSGFSILNQGQHMAYLPKLAAEESDTGPAGFAARELLEVNTDRAERNFAARELFETKTVGTERNFAIGDAFAMQTSKPKVNNVVENIVTIENSVGSYWTNQIAVEDNKNDIKVKLEGAVQDKVSGWLLENQVAGVQIPAEVLGALKDAEDDKLLDIEDFTEENLEKFIASLQVQCETGKSAKRTLQDYVSKAGSKLKDQIYLEQYYFVLNNIISTCCMVERFRVLYEEILKRKQLLLDRLVLKEFIKLHPSAEHKAGVHEGGTLIVLYYSKPKNDTIALSERAPSVSDQLVAQNTILNQSDDVLKFASGIDKLAQTTQSLQVLNEKISADNVVSNEFSKLFNISDLTFGNLGVLDDFIVRPVSSLADGTVIGDLCLPYICCAETPATTFVFPDRETNLFVPKEFVCVIPDGSAELIPITPTPSDGEVIAFAEGVAIADAIQINTKKYFFDPNAVNADDYGKEITFTVDGQNVIPVLTVYERPQPEFTVEEPEFSSKNKRATIKITNTSKEIEGQTFEWDFEVDQFENGLLEFDYRFNVEPGTEYSFNLKLTATNGRCVETFELPLDFVVPENEVEIGLIINSGSICKLPGNEAAMISVQPTPPNATVIALVDGGEIANGIVVTDGGIFFDPNALDGDMYDKTISFTVNAQAVENTLIIHEQPQPSFAQVGEPAFSNNNTQMNIGVKNTSKAIAGQKFKWSFNGDEFENDSVEFQYPFEVVPDSVFNVEIKLDAINGPCGAPALPLNFEVEIPKLDVEGNGEGTENTCIDTNLGRINDGRIRLNDYRVENEDKLVEFIFVYDEFLLPLYTLVKDDAVNVMNGKHDATFRDNIRNAQNEISAFYLDVVNMDIREWLIRLYLESTLLYFYILACRETKISANTVTGAWIEFIATIVENDPDLVNNILTQVPYHDHLNDLLKELTGRLSETVNLLLNDIINALTSTLE
ncbi:MAG: hypothetical protein AAGA77_03350 [Bacteroidota bacterium]